ncbi:hypothetical protein GCM10011608_15620 [Micromonospora sonchi]|uniref:Uncharacterized protein n=1 Tax=Micromonospora sonchi TaxID=1763543 RepID=A0A917WV83_9ACTN|nr:hypothetical protein GCM10011608_15620 [Micromonospora sonchi]
MTLRKPWTPSDVRGIRPLGRGGCQRNYKAVGQFSANKSRLDSAFYEDLKRVCATYNAVVRPACLSLAWTYYQAVSIFGSVAAVSQSDIDRAARMKVDAERLARS